jgi:hypothetical protein
MNNNQEIFPKNHDEINLESKTVLQSQYNRRTKKIGRSVCITFQLSIQKYNPEVPYIYIYSSFFFLLKSMEELRQIKAGQKEKKIKTV